MSNLPRSVEQHEFTAGLESQHMQQVMCLGIIHFDSICLDLLHEGPVHRSALIAKAHRLQESEMDPGVCWSMKCSALLDAQCSHPEY
jgi:hypothetical protein